MIFVPCRYSVFALGSRAYPHFAKFGKDLDRCMQDLKGQRINALVEGDELGGQEQAFKEWSGNVYKVSTLLFWKPYVASLN